METYGQLGVVMLSATVFVLSQISFFFRKLISIDVGYYVLLTFGSLIFIIAGLYLPQILKLKVAGLELEISPVDQIRTPETLGISK